MEKDRRRLTCQRILELLQPEMEANQWNSDDDDHEENKRGKSFDGLLHNKFHIHSIMM